MRRVRYAINIASLIVAFTFAILWLRSRGTWETAYIRTGNQFWKISSGLGELSLDKFSGWPSAPKFHYRVADPDPLKSLTPVFATRFAGANRTEWTRGSFEGAYGTVCVVLKANGSVDWDSPAMPVLNTFVTSKFSAPFSFWSVTIPDWAVVLAFLLWPLASGLAFGARYARGRLHRSQGLCRTCGYDLREPPLRCPECDREAEAAAASPAEA